MNLFLEISVGTVLIIVVTVIHGTGIVLMDKVFHHEARELRNQKLARREFGVMVPMALCLFAIHSAEILAFGAFYWAAGDALSIRDALYQSALAYTTMGVVDGSVSDWPMVIAIEGLAGFLLIGWSAAVFVTDMDKVLRGRN